MINTIVEIEHIKDFDEQGFYSKSYLALDKRLNRQVAVKDIIYENLKSDADFEKYFEANKLKIVHLRGNYNLEKFDELSSDRLIIIAQKEYMERRLS